LGDSYRKLNRFDESIASYDRAIKIKPTYAEVYKKKADSLRNLHQFEDSLLNYEKAIALKPNYPKAYHDAGILFIHNGIYDRGVEFLSKAVK